MRIRSESEPKEPVPNHKPVSKKKPVSNRTHVSQVDSEASLVNRLNCLMKLYYKIHYCIDRAKRIVTDCHVTTGSRHESLVILGRIQYQLDRFGFPVEEVIADAGYASGKNYNYFEEQNICASIPTPSKSSKPKDECDLSPSKTASKTSRASINRNKYKGALERARHRQSGMAFQKKMKERSCKIEGLFGEAKEQHGLRRAKYRGLEKMQIQALLIGITQNLKRLAASVPKDPLEGKLKIEMAQNPKKLAISLDFYFQQIKFWMIQRFLFLRYGFGG